ncbi:MAG: HAD-IA family hydrolase [Deltaproteobacteria bacterium]|nr:HAD-IA family hydrolase [Deltaproteobacteria bacterium]
MSFHQIKAIFFDAAGTLFTVNGSVGEIYARIARAHGQEVSVTDLEAGFRRCFATAPPMAFPGALVDQLDDLEKQWWRDVVQNVFAPLGPFPRFSEYFAALFTYFAQTEAWQLYPEARATLVELRDRGFKLGVISNFDSRLFGLLEGFGIAPFFDPIIISTRAGAAKPDGEIFTQALSCLGLDAEEALHVGDSIHADIVGAHATGLLPVLIDRRGAEADAAHYHRIQNLAELSTIAHLRE